MQECQASITLAGSRVSCALGLLTMGKKEVKQSQATGEVTPRLKDHRNSCKLALKQHNHLGSLYIFLRACGKLRKIYSEDLLSLGKPDTLGHLGYNLLRSRQLWPTRQAPSPGTPPSATISPGGRLPALLILPSTTGQELYSRQERPEIRIPFLPPTTSPSVQGPSQAWLAENTGPCCPRSRAPIHCETRGHLRA